MPYASFGWREAFEKIMPHLPDALVPSKSREDLERFIMDAPGIWHWGMFETRLGAGESPVDLLGAMAQAEQTRASLKHALSMQHAALTPARAVLSAWSDQHGGAFGTTPNLWLEWDRDRADRPPLAWLCIAPHFFDKSQQAPTPAQIGLLADEFMNSDSALLVPGASEKLVELAERLPQGGQLMGFASLKPRGRAVCRTFATLPRGGTLAWLNAIGWAGPRRSLDDALPLFQVEGEREWCQIEFDAAVGPHLALELAQTERGFAARGSRRRWLDEACRRGWSTPEKADAVMAWHGGQECRLESGLSVQLLRSFHLKLVLAQDGPPQAKGYLGFYFRKQRDLRANKSASLS